MSKYSPAPIDARIRRTIDETPGVTDKQRAYIFGLLEGKSSTQAAKDAGYGSTVPTIVHRSVGVQRALSTCVEQFIVGEALPVSMGVLMRLLEDDRTPAGVRKDIGFGFLDRAGFDAKRFQRQQEQGKDVSAMSSDELRHSIDKLQAEIEGRARDVTPNDAPNDTQDIDLYP